MYHFKEINSYKEHFFNWKKSLIDDLIWARIPKASKSIFPVIADHWNHRTKVAFPSEETIAALSGITRKQVRLGVRGMKGFPGFDIAYYITEHGHRAKRYKLCLPEKPIHGKTFAFNRFILVSGMWRMLKPSAKALYPVMRRYSYFDFYDYMTALDNDAFDLDTDFDKVFANRFFDFCKAEPGILAKYSGIHRSSLKSATANLKQEHLIEFDSALGCWRVYLKTKNGNYYIREFLNNQLMSGKYRK